MVRRELAEETQAKETMMASKHPKVEFYRRSDDDWGWRLVGGNGEIQASGEGHPTLSGAKRAYETMVTNAMNAETIVEEPDEEE
jgi:uncharacterized protein YegP (UPF0339 family)